MRKDLQEALVALAEEDWGLAGALIDATWKSLREKATRGELTSILDIGTQENGVAAWHDLWFEELDAQVREFTKDRDAFWAKMPDHVQP